MGKYLMSLMLMDFVQGSAFALNFVWASRGHVTVNGVCVAQGESYDQC
jgi:hypothetical protein